MAGWGQSISCSAMARALERLVAFTLRKMVATVGLVAEEGQDLTQF